MMRRVSRIVFTMRFRVGRRSLRIAGVRTAPRLRSATRTFSHPGGLSNEIERRPGGGAESSKETKLTADVKNNPVSSPSRSVNYPVLPISLKLPLFQSPPRKPPTLLAVVTNTFISHKLQLAPEAAARKISESSQVRNSEHGLPSLNLVTSSSRSTPAPPAAGSCPAISALTAAPDKPATCKLAC